MRRGFERKIFEREIKKVGKEEIKELQEKREPEDATKEMVFDESTKKAEETKTKFLEKWADKNERRIKRRGFDPKNKNKEYIKMVAQELDADKDLLTKWKYKKYREEISNLIALREKVGIEDEEGNFIPKETTDLTDKYLMLNFLNNRVKEKNLSFTKENQEKLTELEEKQEKLGENLEDDEKKALEELNKKKELFDAQKDLAEKITGRDLEAEANNFVKEIEGLKGKVESNKEDLREKEKTSQSLRGQASDKEGEAQRLKGEISKKEEEVKRINENLKIIQRREEKLDKTLTELDNNLKEAKRRLEEIEDEEERAKIDREISDIESKISPNEEFLRDVNESIERFKNESVRLQREIPVDRNRVDDLTDTASELRKQSMKADKEITKLVRKISENEKEIPRRESLGREGFIQGEINKVAKTPEKQIGKLYNKKREQVAREALLEKIVPKNEEERKEIEETLDKEGINYEELSKALFDPRMFKKITKNPEEGIKSFCKKNNLPFESEAFKDYSGKIKERGWTPEKLVKDEPGILALVFGFLYYMLLGKEERKEKVGEYLEGLIKTE